MLLEGIMLEVSNLVAGYGEVEVVHDVSLRVDTSEIVTLLGSNGAGKSTINNNISGIYVPFSGTIKFDDIDITNMASEKVVDMGVVQVPEGRRVFPNMRVRENLELGSYRRGKASRSANMEKVTAVFPRLKERFDQLAGTLSGGEQQMLAIGRALMAEPRLLILDEPSLGLSPILVEEMFNLIKTLHDEGLSIFLVEQNVFQSLDIADRAYVIENGIVTMSGAADEMMQNPDLKKSYMGL
jgi:branched-chain amino acid transport system ATP-binding protein